MIPALRLSVLRFLHYPGQTLAIVLSVAAAIFVPATTHRVVDAYRKSLTARAQKTPLVMGAKGNRFDLTLSALYLRTGDLEPLRRGDLAGLDAAAGIVTVPLHLRFTARGFTIAGTTPEYYEWKRLQVAAGTLPLVLGDALLGAQVAQTLKIGPGDKLFSDPLGLYDISKPPALQLNVVGVLESVSDPEDNAVFVDLKTTWLLDGFWHGHEEAGQIEQKDLVLGESEEHRILSPALIESQTVTKETLASFHLHGDPAALPIHAAVLVPKDAKAATLAKSRVNTGTTAQVVEPVLVVGEMLDLVFEIKRFVDRFAILLLLSTFLLVGLVFFLSSRLREREMVTLQRIGCDRGLSLRLYATEAAAVLLAGAVLAVVATLVVTEWLGDVTRWI